MCTKFRTNTITILDLSAMYCIEVMSMLSAAIEEITYGYSFGIYFTTRIWLVVYYKLWYNKWLIGVLGHDSALLRLYWAGDNLGECDEICYEPCPWHRIDRSTCWLAVQRATTVPRMPPSDIMIYCLLQYYFSIPATTLWLLDTYSLPQQYHNNDSILHLLYAPFLQR